MVCRLNGKSEDSYNDVGRTEISIRKEAPVACREGMAVAIEPHSVNIIQIRPQGL